jgi:[ribosomal protein S5]-alanine N-acetyltransferase
MKNIIIKTERFLLRPLVEDDVDDHYLSWINGSNKSSYIDYSSQNRSIEEIRAYIHQRKDDDSVLFLGIFVRESGKHIGNIKYEPIDFVSKIATMGILIGEKKWRGKGVATEVIKYSSIWLYNNYNLKKIVLGVNVRNKIAINAYKKVGFEISSNVGDKEHLSMFLNIEC